MDILSISLGLIGLLGIIPIIIESDKYVAMLKNCLANEDLICESIQITFDIVSQEETRVYSTEKYKVKRNGAKLILQHKSDVGRNDKIVTRIDNRLLKNEFVEINDKAKIMTYDVSDKKIGEKFIVEDEFVFFVKDLLPSSYDGNYIEIFPYKCKYFNLHVIFPADFIPLSLSFVESIEIDGKRKVKFEHDTLKHLACFSQNRKQIQWAMKYPKFKYKYSVNWRWSAN